MEKARADDLDAILLFPHGGGDGHFNACCLFKLRNPSQIRFDRLCDAIPC